MRHVMYVTAVTVFAVCSVSTTGRAQTCSAPAGVDACSSNYNSDNSSEDTIVAAVYGEDDNSGTYGVYGASENGAGVYGSSSNVAVFGVSDVGIAIHGTTSSGLYAIEAGHSGSGVGLYASSSTGIGVEGVSNGSGDGVYGSSSSGDGVVGEDQGTSSGSNGVKGISHSSSGTGVYAENEASSGNAYGLYAKTSSSSGYAIVASGAFVATGKWYFSVGGTCQYNCSSDERLKKNIEPLTGAVDRLLRLRGVTFEWRKPEAQGNDEGGPQIGFIAQDVEKVDPRWVGQDRDGYKTLTIQQTQFNALTVESVRTLKERADKADADLAAIKKENDELRTRFDLANLPNAGYRWPNGAPWAVAGALLSYVWATRRKQIAKQS